MRLLLVGNYAPDKQQSMQAYARLLLRGCRTIGIDAELIAPRAVLLPSKGQPVGAKKWIAYIDKFIIFPLQLRRMAKDADWTHVCDHSNGMYLFWLPRKRSSITCHDVIAMQAARGAVTGWNTGRMGRIFQALILRGVARARKIVCVSNLTRDDLIDLRCDIGEKTLVVPNALHSHFAPDGAWRKVLRSPFLGWLGDEQYFVYVGSDHPRKNRLAVVRIFAALLERPGVRDLHLVLVGPPPSAEMDRIMKEHAMESRISTIQNAPLNLLIGLYSGALALIFPSLNEGFGWPIVEAQACGCPVFASNLPPMPEVGGAAAVY